MKIKQFLYLFGLLAGTIIGAGVFSLPYLFKFSGFITGFFYLALATVAYIIIYQMYAEIVEKTPGDHRFVGFANIYLGKWASWSAVLMTVAQSFLVLTIYLILSQSFAHLITRFGDGIEKMIIFWFFASVAIFISLRKIALIELLITAGMIGIFAILFVLGIPGIASFNFNDFNVVWGNFLLPFAPILFALSGRVAIPAMVKLGGPVKPAIKLGVIVPAVLYGAFAISIVALAPLVTEDAVTGLRGAIPAWALMAVGILGILSLISSYITVGYDTAKSMMLDMRMPSWVQFVLVSFGPILLYFGGLKNFLGLVSIVGGVFIGLESIFIVLMWQKMNQKKFSAKTGTLVFIFAVAVAYEIIKAI